MVFEVLVVFLRAPGTTPAEAVLEEEAVAEVAFLYLVAIALAAVGIGFACGGFYYLTASFVVTDVGVVEGIDVDGETTCVVGQLLSARDGAITETAGVVGAHLALVVGIVVVGQTDALDGVVGLVELTEDGQQLGGYQTVTDEFALMGLIVVVPMEHPQVAQVAALDIGIGHVGLSLHLLPYAVGNRLSGETFLRMERRERDKG